MGVKIELTLPALERLLGGDTEMEVGLRQGIVEEFARKRLKALLNEEAFKAVCEAWQAELRQTMVSALTALAADRKAATAAQTLDTDGLWSIKGRIKELVEAEVQNRVHEAFEERIAKTQWYYERLVNDRIRATVDAEVAKRIEEGIRQRLEAAAKMPG